MLVEFRLQDEGSFYPNKLVVLYVTTNETLQTFTEKIERAVASGAFGLDTSRSGLAERRVGSLEVFWVNSFESSVRSQDELWACLRMMQCRGWKDHFCAVVTGN